MISVIIPVYNIKEYLPRCVHSVTAQTYPKLEIILVDDGSTDGTDKLCDQLALEDYRIRTYHKKNGGSSSARNIGLQLMSGDYVGFVDSDDYIEPDAYEKLMQGILETGASIAQMGRDEIDEQGNLLPDICIPPEKQEFLKSEDFMRELLMHRGDCSFCTKLLKSDLLKTRRFPEGKLNEDFYLMIHLLTEVDGVLSLPDRGYHVFYRMGSNSRRENKNDFSRVFADNVENADVAAGIVKDYFPALTETAFRFGIFQRLDYMLHIPISMMTKENTVYVEIVKYLRKNWGKAMGNSLLTKKNKIYHTLFAMMPKGVRVIHKKLKGL
ncbi:MAG: glycosyltransferase family 2 protein [Lachnospiraceae bacterium]|nr:glycosyltransferase family 2 protein [Lachnospiraceae bacterium]